MLVPRCRNWVLQNMCALYPCGIKSRTSDITVVRYRVCQHFSLVARRSRSLNTLQTPKSRTQTCLLCWLRNVRLIRLVTTAFFMKFWRFSPVVKWKSAPCNAQLCSSNETMRWLPHPLRWCSLLWTCQFIIRSKPATLQSVAFCCLVTWAFGFIYRMKCTYTDTHTYTHTLGSKLIPYLSNWSGFESKLNLKYDASAKWW